MWRSMVWSKPWGALIRYNRFLLPKLWGSGQRAAADGTKWDVYEQNLLSEYHLRYGGWGGIGYYHVSARIAASDQCDFSCKLTHTMLPPRASQISVEERRLVIVAAARVVLSFDDHSSGVDERPLVDVLGQHDRRQIGRRGGDVRHDRGVDHAQILDAVDSA